VKQDQRTFTLGGTELNRIGLGTNRLTASEASSSFLRAAVDAGLDFIDTAHLYTGGGSESAIGAALAPVADQVIVATKGGYHSNEPAALRVEIERSFERLRTDVIDLWYLHRARADAPLEETMGLLAEYVDAGRIRTLGLSEVGVAEIETARAVTPIAAVQNEYSLAERMHESVIDHCDAEGIIFVPFFPLSGGDSPALGEIATRHGASPNQIKLAWLLHRSPCVLPIPGTLSLDHLRENLAALDIDLDPDELEALEGD
jgi:pyridoxine 4-dehydrogenase